MGLIQRCQISLPAHSSSSSNALASWMMNGLLFIPHQLYVLNPIHPFLFPALKQVCMCVHVHKYILHACVHTCFLNQVYCLWNFLKLSVGFLKGLRTPCHILGKALVITASPLFGTLQLELPVMSPQRQEFVRAK